MSIAAMTPLRILIDDCRAWKRLRFTGGEWAVLYGFTAGLVPALSGALAMVIFHLIASILDRQLDLVMAGLPFMIVLTSLLTLLWGFVPASLAYLALKTLAGALGYINLQLTLIVAGLGTAISTFLVLGIFHAIAITITVSALIVTTTLWSLLRAGGLGTRLTPDPENPASPPLTTPH